MAYGTVKVNFITYDEGAGDQTITVSDLASAITSGITVTGTISGLVVEAVSGSLVNVSGETLIYTSGTIDNLNVVSGIFASGTVSNPSITFTGDLDTGFYSPVANTVAVTTAGGESIRFASNQRVGINTTGPSARLDVKESGTVPALLVTQSGTGHALSVSGTSLFSGAVTVSGNTTVSGAVAISGSTTLNAQSELRLADSDSSNYVGFKSPATVPTNVVWTLPSGDGSSTNVLHTNGAGVTYWSGVYVEPSDGDKGDITVSSNGLVWNIDSGVISNQEISATAEIAFSKLALISSGNVLIGNGATGKLAAQSIGGDVTINDSGTVSIGAAKVTNTMLAGSITDSKLNTISTANKVSLSALNIDGGTDIGAAIADADLFIVDDGGAGTNRKTAASRVPTYVYSKVSGDITIDSSGIATIDRLTYKPACRVATTANITLSGTQTIDGVSLSVGDRVLVKNQSTGSQNGIYVVASGSWTRAVDFSDSTNITDYGAFTLVREGSTHADTPFILTTDGTITIGTTSLAFAEISSGGGTYTAGNGLQLVGSEFSLAPLTSSYLLIGNASNVATATAVTGDVTISNTGVTSIGAGVIVNADINASAAISHSKLASITAGSILLGNASNVPTATAVSGDITINSSGVTAIAAGAIVNADVNASAAIDYSKLASLTAGYLLVGNVSNIATPTAITGDITIDSSGVTSIATGVIVNADINSSAAIEDTKLNTISTVNKVSLSALDIDGGTDIGANLVDADLFIVDDGGAGTNRKTAASRLATYLFGKVSGDFTINSTGTGAIAAGAIVNADINASANIADTKLATISTAGKVSGTAITSGNISTSGSFATTSTVAVGQSSAASNTDFDLNGTYAQTIIAVAALNIDCSLGNYFTKTISTNSTFTVSNVPASRAYCFTIEITHTSGTITWFSGVEWSGGVAPTLTTGKTHLFFFLTDDGGTRWRAAHLIDYTN